MRDGESIIVAISSKQFYRRVIYTLSVLFGLIWMYIAPRDPNYMSSNTVILYGFAFGIPGFLLFACYLLAKLKKLPVSDLTSLSLRSPFIYLPFYFSGIPIFCLLESIFNDSPWTADIPFSQKFLFSLQQKMLICIIGIPFAIIVACFFIGITRALYLTLRKNGFIQD